MLENLVKNKIAFWIMIIFIGFWAGIYSFLNIPKEDSPAMDIPMFVVNTINPWADPEAIESQITNKLEDEFKSISWIKKIESVSNPNVSTVIVSFNDNKSIADAKLDLDSAVWKTSLPSWASNPIIKQISPDDVAAYSFSIAWNYVAKNIYEKSKTLEDEIKKIEWISEIIVTWKPEKKINIFLDEKKINEFWLDIKNIQKLLSNIFIKQPIWKKDIWGNLYNYEITTFESDLDKFLEQLKQTDLLSYNSQSIKLKDVANIYFEEVSNTEKSFIIKNNDDLNSISFDVKIAPGKDVESIIKQISKKIENFKKKNPELKIFETFSKLTQINDVFDTFVSNFRQSWLIILFILVLFVGFRISFWVTIAFPLVYFLTFICLMFMWYTFNNIVSFALVLSLWIMVDNLIVISEWIANELKSDKNIDFWQALSNTFKNYSFSIVAWTLTTIAMFVPILFMLSWTIWKYIAPMSTTIIITLTASIFTAFFLLPVILKKTLSSKWWTKVPYFWRKLEKVSEMLWSFSKIFIKSKKRAFATVVLFWVFFSISIWAIWAGFIKQDFLPPSDQDNIWINIKFPSWFSSEKTQEQTSKILKDVKWFLDEKYPNYVDFYYVNIWNVYSTNAVWWASNITADSQSYINLKLISWDDRNTKSYKISENLQSFINKNIKNKYPSIKNIYTVSWMSLGWWKDIWFSIVWDNLKEIANYIEKIKPEIEKINGIYNLTTNLEFTNWKIKYFLDANKIQKNQASLESFLLLFASIKNSDYFPNWIPLKKFTEFWKDDVTMTLFTNYKGNIEDLKVWENFISQISKEKDLETELKNIQHLDTKLQISLEADKSSDIALWAITTKIDEIIKENPLPENLSFKYNSNISDQKKSTWDLWAALWVWVLLMFLILVWQFNSIWISLIVLTSTLLSVIWIVAFLWMFGLSFSFPAQLWIFWVIWVWVNNAILFTDLFNTKKQKDLKKDLSDTITQRFPAIFLTTFTTIAWLVTLAIKDELWWSLAIAFMWWLAVNVFITLIYLPAFFLLVTKPKDKN